METTQQNGGKDRDSRKTLVGQFLGRIHRSKSRGASDAKNAEKLKNGSAVPNSKSDGNIQKNPEGMSPARRMLNRFNNFRSSSRNRAKTSESIENGKKVEKNGDRHLNGVPVKTTSEHDLHKASIINKTTPQRLQNQGISAASEMDLRFVTSRNDHISLPLEDNFGFGEKSPRGFLSETDLTSGAVVADMPAINQRTPSYLRISCALNGYTRSPNKMKLNDEKLGESLVERRMRMFNQPQERATSEFSSPTVSSSTTSTKEEVIENFSTPIQKPTGSRLQQILQQSEMGNQISTPGPIRDLISKFDQLDLCSVNKSKSEEKEKEEDVENIKPHNFVINQQPDFGDELTQKKEQPNDNSEKAEIEKNLEANLSAKLAALDVESDSGISGGGNSENLSPDGSKKGEEPMARDGKEFREIHDREKLKLQAKMEEAAKDLENVDNIPEKCADSLRAANGNAHLLVRKKFGKFSELIEKNMTPIPDDPMPVNLPDLEAFWQTIEMEMEGILKEFEKVEKYRISGWNEEAVDEKEEVKSTRPSTAGAGGAKKKKPTVAKKEISGEAKEKLEKQRAAAEQRRAEMRAQMRQKMQKMKETEPGAESSEPATEC